MAAAFLRMHTTDLANSIIAMDGETVAGILVVNRRGTTSRVGAMAVAPEYRSQGVGAKMMSKAIEDAKFRNDLRIILEAIAHNERAIAFYDRFGYQVQHRLLGFEHPPLTDSSAPSIQEIDLDQLAALLLARPQSSLSWETSAAAAIQYVSPTRAFEHEGMGAAIVHSSEFTMFRTVALSGRDDVRKLKTMLEAFNVIYPGCSFKAQPAFPEPEFGEVFEKAGFVVSDLKQVEMRLTL